MVDRCKRSRKNPPHGFTVTYNSARHCGVLGQCWGSVWPKVIPYCIANVALSIVLQLLKSYHVFHIRITDRGHSYMTLLVAFLLVTRATVILTRYNQVRTSLEDLYCAQRQLIHQIVVCSSDNVTRSAKEWRQQIAYLSLLHLSATMSMIEDTNESVPTWDTPEFDDATRAMLMEQLFPQEESHECSGHMQASVRDNNIRVPACLAFSLRQIVVSQRDQLEKPLVVFEELALLNTVDSIMNAVLGIHYFMMAPIPFPLIQMARTILFVYVFTIPFALLEDISIPVAHLFVVFFLTYGFLGIEYVSIELDNPFGNDDNDFNSIRMAHVSYEDTYTVIADMDGDEWADGVRRKMDTTSYRSKAEHWIRSDHVI